MAMNVQGASIAGVTDNGIPMVEGSNNLIKINIDNPINIDLNTFKDNIYPYVSGNNNIVNIDILGTDNFISNIQIDNENLVITKRTVNGEETYNIKLPNCRDGELSSLRWLKDTNTIIGNWEQVIGVDNEPMDSRTVDFSYNVVTNDIGEIISIERGV